MKAIHEFSTHIQAVLREMCKRVEADTENIDFGKHNWFWEYEWTKEQEKDFVEWLADYLYTSTEARREMARFPRKTKKDCSKVAYWFVWNHGWKTAINSD